MRRTISRPATLFVLLANASAASLAGQATPLDSALARTLLEEATTALRDARTSGSDTYLVDRLARLRDAWGLDGDEVLALRTEPARSELERLVEQGAWDDAVALVRQSDPMGFPPLGFEDLLRGLIDAGLDERSVEVAAHVNRLATATYWILNTAGVPPEARIARITELFDKGVIPPESQLDVRRQVLWLMSDFDSEAAWAATDTIMDQADRAALRVSLASRGQRLGEPQADRQLMAVYDDVLSLDDEIARGRHMRDIWTICQSIDSDVCRDFVLPPEPAESLASRLGIDARNAINAGRLDEAGQLLDSLRAYISPSEIALLVVRELASHRLTNPLLEPSIIRWSSDAEALAATAEPAVADSLLQFVVPLVAPRNSAKAFEVAERIRDVELRSGAYAAMAQSLVDIDVKSAWDAARRGADQYTAREVAARLYPLLRSLGDTIAAAEALEMMRPVRAVNAELEWAERLGRSGQWAAGRAIALSALERWSTIEDPGGAPGPVGVFVDLGMYDELVVWARALEHAGRRALALITVVEAAPLPSEPIVQERMEFLDSSCLSLPGCDIIGNSCSCTVRIVR